MKRKYFKLKSTALFTYAVFLNSVSQTEIDEINKISKEFIEKYKFSLEYFEVNKEEIAFILACAGKSIFEKKEEDYFILPKKIFPIFIYLKKKYFLLDKGANKNSLSKNKIELLRNLLEFDHTEYEKQFDLIKGEEIFIKNFIKDYRSFLHFINTYYSLKPKKVIIKRQGGLNV